MEQDDVRPRAFGACRARPTHRRDLQTEADPTRIERVATATVFVDRIADCRESLWRVVRDGRDGGAIASAINSLMLLALDAFQAGRWDEIRDLTDEGLEL